MMYEIPDQYFFRIHHVRPRFKDDIESVLMYMAESIAGLKPQDKEAFKQRLNTLIYAYPGNADRTLKTINNWRTEISALFGLFETHGDKSKPGKRAIELAASGDLVGFFKKFLFTFQYPGAHIKSKSVLEQIEHGVHFKPAQYILKVFQEAKNRGMHLRLTKAEVCHCIFNDLRATSGIETPSQTLDRILANKAKHVTYDETGDVIRYAGDILDYMFIANLLRNWNGEFALNSSEGLMISKFVNSNNWFNEYDQMIKTRTASLDEINDCIEGWFTYVNSDVADKGFDTDIESMLEQMTEENSSQMLISLKNFLKNLEVNGTVSTSQIGDMGESIVINHEKLKLTKFGFSDLIHLIRKIPTALGVGYDVQSFEADGTRNKRYIEVKTTISANPIKIDRVHLTSNEWNSAETLRNTYYVYRLQITRTELILFIIRNPVQLYKDDKITMTPEDDGAELRFTPLNVGHYEDVLI